MRITTINLLLLTLCLAPFTKADTCNPTKSFCASCDGAAGPCISCIPGAAKLTTDRCFGCNREEYSPGGGLTGPCTLCPKGKTTDGTASTSASQCTLDCHVSCYNCRFGNDENTCITCHANHKLSAGIMASCVPCEVGKVSPDANAATTCQDCNLDCKTCSGAGPDKCTACKANFKLSGTAPSSCTSCGDGKFSLDGNTATACQDCSPNCKTCSVAGADKCTTCKANFILSGTAPSSCTSCGDGKFSLDAQTNVSPASKDSLMTRPQKPAQRPL